jgi:secreted PhoX family phosphatase
MSTPAVSFGNQSGDVFTQVVKSDPARIIDLPDGFSYTIVSRVGEVMSDGLPVPGAHDGMAAFEGENGRIILICNHELRTNSTVAGPYGDALRDLPEELKSRFYDRGADLTPELGGTTTTIYDPGTRKTEHQFLSLAGTEWNCAGGRTPWNSWLTCEESFAEPGTEMRGIEITRDKRHGYVFEVPASATELVQAVPLKEMGRFEHEAAAVHEPTGVVYLTEDQWHSLFYRFIPNVPGQLHEGGRLQALAIVGEPGKSTHNWDKEDVRLNEFLETRWIDLDDVDGDENDLRLRGAAAGAATFARGEGLCLAEDQFAFTCTIGGSKRLGQVFTYKPSPFEGTEREQDSPGQLTLIAEADEKTLFNNCDNLTMAPWGDLIVCEDTEDDSNHCGLIGIRPDGSQYLVANNAHSDSELAGACFSPDGKTLFLNIQYPGMTLAITGPWPN